MGSNNLQIRFITINKRPMDSVLCSFRRPILFNISEANLKTQMPDDFGKDNQQYVYIMLQQEQ